MRYISNENSRNKRYKLNKSIYRQRLWSQVKGTWARVSGFGRVLGSGCAFIAALTICVTTIITASVHFSVDELGEIDDRGFILASSKPEVENTLDVDQFYEHLHECVKHYPYSC